MIEQYQIENANKLIQMVRFLLTEADKQGLTHGEKHHIIKVCLMLLADVQVNELGYQDARNNYRNEVNIQTLSLFSNSRF